MMEQQPVKQEQQATEKEEETDHSDYDAKIQAMQKYVPFLNQLIQRLETSENIDESKIMQMQLFRRILQNTAERIKIDELQQCELALSKIYELHEQNNNCDNNSGSNEPTNTLDQTEETNEENAATTKENTSLIDNITSNEPTNTIDQTVETDEEKIATVDENTSLIKTKTSEQCEIDIIEENTLQLEIEKTKDENLIENCIEIEPEMVFVPQIENACSMYENEDDFQYIMAPNVIDLNKESSSEDENSRPRLTSIANIDDCDIDDNDDIQVIEVRNSPICLDSDDDNEEDEEATKSQRSRTPTSPISNASPAKKVPLTKGKGYARKSTANSASISRVKRNRTLATIDLLDSSEGDSDTLATNSDTSQSPLTRPGTPQSKFFNSINLRPRKAKKNSTQFQITPSKTNTRKKKINKKSTVSCSKSQEIERIHYRSHRRWLENFITNFACHYQRPSPIAFKLLQLVLDATTFAGIVKMRSKMNELCVNSTNHTDFELMSKLRNTFLDKDQLKPIGLEFCAIISQQLPFQSATLTTDTRNGRVTSRTRTLEEMNLEMDSQLSKESIGSTESSTHSNRKRRDEDIDYTPDISVDNIKGPSLRRSLRTKITNSDNHTYEENNDDSDEDMEEAADVDRKVQEACMNAQRKREKDVKSFEAIFPLSVVSTEYGIDSATTTQNENDIEQPEKNDIQSQSFGANTIFEADVIICSDTETTNNDVIDLSDDIVPDQLSQSVQDTSWPKNTSIMSTMKNSNDYCVICQCHRTHIVHHYVNLHRGCEIYHCRFTEKQLRSIVLDSTKTKAISVYNKCGELMYSAICLFCAKRCQFKMHYWHHHFAMHTGEYAYRCSGCGVRKPTRSLMLQHINQPCPTSGSQLVQDYYYNSKDTKIEASICNICNYTQLRRANIAKHLKTQHNIKDILPTHIRHIPLLTLPHTVSKTPLSSGAQSKSNNARQDSNSANASNQNYFDTSGNFLSEERVGHWVDEGDPTDDLSFLISGRLDVQSYTNINNKSKPTS